MQKPAFWSFPKVIQVDQHGSLHTPRYEATVSRVTVTCGFSTCSGVEGGLPLCSPRIVRVILELSVLGSRTSFLVASNDPSFCADDKTETSSPLCEAWSEQLRPLKQMKS